MRNFSVMAVQTIVMSQCAFGILSHTRLLKVSDIFCTTYQGSKVHLTVHNMDF